MRVAALRERAADGRSYEIRSLRPNEAGLLLDQLHEVQISDPDVHFTGPDEFAWTVERLRGRIEALNRAPNGLYLAAIDGLGVAGSLNLVGGGQRKTAHVAALGMGVRRDRRRLGVGRRLVEVALEAARRSEDIAVVVLTVFGRNEPARRLYESLGFAVEGRREGGVRIGGRAEDVLFLSQTVS